MKSVETPFEELCYIALGSNLGDRIWYLNSAVRALQSNPKIKVLRQSSWIETQPEGKTDQPLFLNGVVEIKTNLRAKALLEALKTIEQNSGRVHREVWGPREIDLDILFYGNHLICEEELTIPHPLLHTRIFVLKPLMELAPNLVHPAMDQTISELLATLRSKSGPVGASGASEGAKLK